MLLLSELILSIISLVIIYGGINGSINIFSFLIFYSIFSFYTLRSNLCPGARWSTATTSENIAYTSSLDCCGLKTIAYTSSLCYLYRVGQVRWTMIRSSA
jgi:hypothetical protein